MLFNDFSLKMLILAQKTILFGGAEKFVKFWQRALWRAIMQNYFKFGRAVQEMLFKDFSFLLPGPKLNPL